jgi:hypothetical protein
VKEQFISIRRRRIPTKALYKYPQGEFPHPPVEENRRRAKDDPEFEINDTGVFDGNRYFDIFAEYAKHSPDDILIRITVHNRGPEAATLHLLPTLWYRNTWSWSCTHEGCTLRPRLRAEKAGHRVTGTHESLGTFTLIIGPGPDGRPPPLLFTENESNTRRLWGAGEAGAFVKDAFHEYIVHGRKGAVSAKGVGTKAGAHYVLNLEAGQSQIVRLRLFGEHEPVADPLGAGFESTFAARVREADDFYAAIIPAKLTEVERGVVRQGYAGLLWSKQFYHYIVEDWLLGDPGEPAPSAERKTGRNHEDASYSRDVIRCRSNGSIRGLRRTSAFHMIPFAHIDPKFAKEQLHPFLREWACIPTARFAYEFAFGDVNPPVHARGVARLQDFRLLASRDRDFLESVFQKLLLNFTWWVNRKDAHGKNLFSGGFLGLDNIGVFDRSKPLPTGGTLQQADGTAWMAFYCATMLSMALELAHSGDKIHPAYEDMASKFLEHFVQIADAMNTLGGTGLWHQEDGFYYDQIRFDHSSVPLKTRSMVGLLLHRGRGPRRNSRAQPPWLHEAAAQVPQASQGSFAAHLHLSVGQGQAHAARHPKPRAARTSAALHAR